jgi:hypothetical protein
MNLRQITIIWLSVSVFLPSAYFVISGGIELERTVRENREIREGSVDQKDAPRRYFVTFERDGKTLTYEAKSNHFPRSEEEIEKLLATGRQLSESEIAAWNEKEHLEKSRRLYWELAATGFFFFASLSSLLAFRTKSKEPNKTLATPTADL